MSEYVPAVGCDFDGVIHAYSKGWQDGTIYDEPVPGALDGLRWLMERYAVFIHTSRHPLAVAEWLAQRGFSTLVEADGFECTCDTSRDFPHFHEDQCRTFWNEQGRLLVTRRKLAAIAYIDDRGIRFESWHQALCDMVILHNHAATR